jgi:hypothetical protein
MLKKRYGEIIESISSYNAYCIIDKMITTHMNSHCGHVPMVVGFLTTYAISAYHHECCELTIVCGGIHMLKKRYGEIININVKTNER